jgi:hypothetical protein
MPWPGFSPGKGKFTIGWFTGSPGHMSGNIGGLNIESAGGVGVRVGSAARSPLSFGRVAHYERGTDFVPHTGPAVVHRGERITPARDNQRQTALLEELVRLMRIGGGRALVEVGAIHARDDRAVEQAIQSGAMKAAIMMSHA